MPDVSIIIVNWNTKQLLLDTIESLYIETKDSSLEIIVVDNGSTDGSPDALREAFPDVVLICNDENLGFAKANNIGIKRSTGRYVCLVNSDIIALDGVVDRLCEQMDANPKIGAIGPKNVSENGDAQLSCREYPTLRNIACQAFFLNKVFPGVPLFRGREMTWFSHDEARPVEVLSGCFLMVRREVIDKVGVLDDLFFIYGEDVDWCKRISDAGWGILFFAEAKAIHIGGASSSLAPVRFLVEMLKANLQYWQKHHGQLAQLMFGVLMFLHFSIRAIGWSFVFLFLPRKREAARVMIQGYVARANWLLFNRGKRPIET